MGSNDQEMNLVRKVAAYSNAVGRHGPDSPETKEVREKFADDNEFIGLADALDRIKRTLGGSGIDYKIGDE